jgi:hypothetical protein
MSGNRRKSINTSMMMCSTPVPPVCNFHFSAFLAEKKILKK